MTSFYLKHPTKSDFWTSISNIEITAPVFWAFQDIKEFLRNKEGVHNLSPEYVQDLIQKIDVFDNHPSKTQSWYYSSSKKANRKTYVVRIPAPMSFGASQDKFAQKFDNLQTQIIDPLKQCLEYGEKLKEIEKEVKETLLVFPYWTLEKKEDIAQALEKNPFTKVKIWNKALQNNSFSVIESGDQARLYNSKAYAVFIDDGSCGYYAHKASRPVPLSEATLFDSFLLAKRQKAKLGSGETIGIVEVDIQFKRIAENPENMKDIGKLQAYYDKEAITQFFAQHNIDKLKEELARLEAQNQELKVAQGLGVSENTTVEAPAKRKNKI